MIATKISSRISPPIFTHQGAAWADMGDVHDIPCPYTKDRRSSYYRDFGFNLVEQPNGIIHKAHYYYKEGNKSALRNALIEGKEWAVFHQVPGICNEFGVLGQTSLKEDRTRYYTGVAIYSTRSRSPGNTVDTHPPPCRWIFTDLFR